MEKKITRRELFKQGGKAALTATVLANIPKNAIAVETKLPRYAMLIDVNRCKGCMACAVACKEEFDVPLGVFRSQVITHEKGKFPEVKRLFLPWLCNHCEKPACIEACPVEPKRAVYIAPSGEKIEYEKKATYKRPDGIVVCDNGLLDTQEDRCVGCGVCVIKCPYKARFMTKRADEESVPEKGIFFRANKCNLCVHRLEKGDAPACVKACPHKARVIGDLNNPNSEISKALTIYEAQGKRVTTLSPIRYSDGKENTESRCFYVGLGEKELFEVYKIGGCISDEAKKQK